MECSKLGVYSRQHARVLMLNLNNQSVTRFTQRDLQQIWNLGNLQPHPKWRFIGKSLSKGTLYIFWDSILWFQPRWWCRDRAVIIVVAVVVIFVFMGVVNRDDFDDICVDCWLFVYVS